MHKEEAGGLGVLIPRGEANIRLPGIMASNWPLAQVVPAALEPLLPLPSGQGHQGKGCGVPMSVYRCAPETLNCHTDTPAGATLPHRPALPAPHSSFVMW